MYEVFIKSWFQEYPNNIQEEIFYVSKNLDDDWEHLKTFGELFKEYYPIVEIGIRLNLNKDE